MIIFEMQMPNAALGRFHKIVKWEMTSDSTHAVINSYASDAMELIAWQDTYTIPLEWKISTIDDIEFILTALGAPMAGGSIVPDTVETLMSAQARKWALVKIERDRRINGTFATSFGAIQIDDKSVLALATTRRILTDEGSTVEWTMADNSFVSLSSANIDTMLDEVVAFQTATHATSQAIRTLIYADDATMEVVAAIDLAAIEWPNPRVEGRNERESEGEHESTEP